MLLATITAVATVVPAIAAAEQHANRAENAASV